MPRGRFCSVQCWFEISRQRSHVWSSSSCCELKDKLIWLPSVIILCFLYYLYIYYTLNHDIWEILVQQLLHNLFKYKQIYIVYMIIYWQIICHLFLNVIFSSYFSVFGRSESCDWLFATDVTSCSGAPRRIKARVDRERWWLASWYQQNLIGWVWALHCCSWYDQTHDFRGVCVFPDSSSNFICDGTTWFNWNWAVDGCLVPSMPRTGLGQVILSFWEKKRPANV